MILTLQKLREYQTEVGCKGVIGDPLVSVATKDLRAMLEEIHEHRLYREQQAEKMVECNEVEHYMNMLN